MCPNHRRLPLQDTAGVTRLHLAGAGRLLHRDTGCSASTEGLGAYSDLRVTQKGTHIDSNKEYKSEYWPELMTYAHTSKNNMRPIKYKFWFQDVWNKWDKLYVATHEHVH